MSILFDPTDELGWCDSIFNTEIFRRFNQRVPFDTYLQTRLANIITPIYTFIPENEFLITNTFPTNFNGFTKYIYCLNLTSAETFRTTNIVPTDHRIITIDELETKLHTNAVDMYFGLMQRHAGDSDKHQTYAKRFKHHLDCLSLVIRPYLDDPGGSIPNS